MLDSCSPGPGLTIHRCDSQQQHRLQNWVLKRSPPTTCPLGSDNDHDFPKATGWPQPDLVSADIFHGHGVGPLEIGRDWSWRLLTCASSKWRQQKQPPVSPLNTVATGCVTCPAPFSSPVLRAPKMSSQPTPVHSVENSGWRVEPLFAGGERERMHVCVCVILFTKRVFTNQVMHSERYLCRKPASHWLEGPLRVAPSQQCLVESNSINNNEESSSSHYQAWAQRGEASYPRSHS